MPRWIRPPAIVAEALVGVSDPLLTLLRPGPEASPAQVAAALAQSLASLEDPVVPPEWLLEEQVPSFRRVIAAVRRYRGALLADPVGSGKTYIALAAAAILNRGPTACLVPATLAAQWRTTAGRLGVPVEVCTHGQVSRGTLPRKGRGLVIVDESHHFRNPSTRRYRHLAPWLVGRPALLVTATPLVNQVDDLVHQLLLTIRDNALAMDGLLSIRRTVGHQSPSPALARIVVETEVEHPGRPSPVRSPSFPSWHECQVANYFVGLIDELQLSRRPPIAQLIRGILLRAAGSSPAALAGALRRYRHLLLHARDSSVAGQHLSRAELQRFTSESGDQLVWWELLPDSAAAPEIELADLERVGDLIAGVEGAGKATDQKVERLRRLLHDGVPTLVFTTWRETVRYLRDHLPEFRMAWCTGQEAGIGRSRLCRSDVLSWFRAPTRVEQAPQHLLVTDVAAEGLDLQRAGRVIHYDLPWTPMRLGQREGRSLRLGSSYLKVAIVRFHSPPVFETRIKGDAILARKLTLPVSAGLGPEGGKAWRWQAVLAARFTGQAACRGSASVVHPQAGLLAGFVLYRRSDPIPLSSTVLWVEPDGTWTEAPETIERWLTVAGAEDHRGSDHRAPLREWMARLVIPIRQRLALTSGRRWMTPEPSPAARELLGRLQGLLRDAARRHQPKRLSCLERVTQFAADGHTAGEDILIERMLHQSEAQMIATAGQSDARATEREEVEARLTGLIVFGPAQAPPVELASPECRSSLPPCSISTEH